MANKRVALPKLPKRSPPVLEKEKLERSVRPRPDTRLYPFIVLASATGCRRGELLALAVADLDERTGELSVSKSLEQTKAGLRVKSTKSEKPRRVCQCRNRRCRCWLSTARNRRRTSGCSAPTTRTTD